MKRERKPKDYWTKDKCAEEALKYKTRSEFKYNSNRVYLIAIKNYWLDEISLHMILQHKPNGYWTKEKCAEEALKYETRMEFKKLNSGSYGIALKNNWLNDICIHMIELKKPNGYWTKELCHIEALKYNTKTEFIKKSGSVYNISIHNEWLEDICLHMINGYKPKGYWTKEKCQEEALKYKTKTEFQKINGSAYNIAYQNRWIDDICSHMLNIGHRYKRCIYAYEFSDNHVYIGLTFNMKDRHNRRLNDKTDQVTIYKLLSGLEPVIKQLTDYVDVEIAKKLEGEYVEKYKESGWNILNKAKSGSVGSDHLIWTFEKCKEEALKYTTKTEFIKKSHNVYNASIKHGWLNDICNHMIELRKHNGYWTKEKCQEEALKYNKKTDFIKNCHQAYKLMRKNEWLIDMCSHMIDKRKNTIKL